MGAADFGQAPCAADISCSLARCGCRLLLKGFAVRLLRPSSLSLVPVSARSVPRFTAAAAMARAKRGSASAAAAALAGELAPVGAAAQPGGIFPLPSVGAPAKAAPRRAARRGRAPAAAPAIAAPSAEVAQVEALLVVDAKAEPEPTAAAGVPVAATPAPAKRRRTAKAIKVEAVAAETAAPVEDTAPAARPKKPRAKPLHRDKAVSAAYEATMAAVASGEVVVEVPVTPPPAKRRRGKAAAAAAAAAAGVCLALEHVIGASQLYADQAWCCRPCGQVSGMGQAAWAAAAISGMHALARLYAKACCVAVLIELDFP